MIDNIVGIYGYFDVVKNIVVYIGKDSHINNQKRHKSHCAPSRYHEQQINKVIQNNLNRYQYFEMIKGNFTAEELNQLEIFYIDFYKKRGECIFNFTDGGDGCLGYCHDENVRKKISQSLKGRKLSKFHKRHLSESHSGKTLSEEHKNKLSKQKVNNKNAVKYTLWNINKVQYDKYKMTRNKRVFNPCNCFILKYNKYRVPCGYFIDYITPELIYDIIKNEVYNDNISRKTY